MARPGTWLKAKAPGLHRFLTRRDGRWPLVREVLAGVIVLGVLVGALYGLTGQGLPFGGGYPVVVVTTGSMMHCENFGTQDSIIGATCTPTHWGRLGTIDPGDLVFVKAVHDASDVVTESEDGGNHYGRAGDVVVYRRNGNPDDTPIIHRSLFWVQVNADRSFSVPSMGLDHVSSLNTPAIMALTGDGCDVTSTFATSAHAYGEAGSGFVTRGDNNGAADQCSGVYPARLEWVLGKARGEVPWIGLINLLWGDIRGGTRHYAEAGGDSKVMFFVTVGVLIAAPWVIEMVLRRRHMRRLQKEEE